MICLPDFNSSDFLQDDFKTSSWRNNINDFLFRLLPDYFKQNDSYKNNYNRGILERYMDIFGDELDEELIPYIECIQNIGDPLVSDEKFIDDIAKSWGSPSNLFISDDRYRNLLKTIVSTYKVKSTKNHVTNLFYLLGFDLVITKSEKNTDFYYYDSGETYDDGGNYDEKVCLPCWEYSATITENVLHTGTPDANDGPTLLKLKSILEYNQPINSKLTSFTLI